MPFRRLRRSALRADQIRAGRRVGELFEEHGRMVHAVCRLILRDRLDAEDATQQTFLSAYRSLLAGGKPNDPPAWLAAIARNECRARRAKRRVAVVPLDDAEGAVGGDVPTAAEQHAEIEALAAALSELPPGQRDAVVLREFYGLSYTEVAAVLGVSAPAVESLLFKGRKRLQEKLGSLRVASAVALPDELREALAQALPGFGGAGAAAGAAKVIALPTAAKVAAVGVLVTGGGATVVGTSQRVDLRRPAATALTAEPKAAAEPSVRVSTPRPHPTSAPRQAARNDGSRVRRRLPTSAVNATAVEPENERIDERAEAEPSTRPDTDERPAPVVPSPSGGIEAAVELEDRGHGDGDEDQHEANSGEEHGEEYEAEEYEAEESEQHEGGTADVGADEARED